jgi:hypothetical protein
MIQFDGRLLTKVKAMNVTVDATFENGALKPLQPRLRKMKPPFY